MNCRRSNETVKLCCKTVSCSGDWDKYSGYLIYWLCAHRYTDNMNFTQALKENMGDPVRKTLHEDQERASIRNGEVSQRFDTVAHRKSDEAIIVLKSRTMRDGAKGFGH